MTALIDAIKDGTVTCIGTDHAPHTAEEKEKALPVWWVWKRPSASATPSSAVSSVCRWKCSAS